ncbi:MAG: hypothetical protein HRT68_07035 [Flavobacteriaceae bacterium]|nr:hypothetical protein [Flavobacteriaceae bacterium]
MNKESFANKKYLEFSNYEGSQHIASEFAIFKVLELAEKFNAKSFLEIGLGIGSIVSSITDYFPKEAISYVGTEANEFCLNSLKTNLKDNYTSVQIFHDLPQITIEKKYDFMIIDGKCSGLNGIENNVNKNAILCIEGDRQDQVAEVKKVFPKAIDVHLISDKKNSDGGVFDTNAYQGGIKVFFVDPTFGQRVYWLKEKIKTKKIYKKRIGNQDE